MQNKPKQKIPVYNINQPHLPPTKRGYKHANGHPTGHGQRSSTPNLHLNNQPPITPRNTNKRDHNKLRIQHQMELRTSAATSLSQMNFFPTGLFPFPLNFFNGNTRFILQVINGKGIRSRQNVGKPAACPQHRETHYEE